jgi:predicted ArsR family transcriptional regulator
MTQYEAIGALLKRKKGATAADLIAATMSTAVHKRMSELRERGWVIRKEPVPGRTYHRYYGQAPQGV